MITKYRILKSIEKIKQLYPNIESLETLPSRLVRDYPDGFNDFDVAVHNTLAFGYTEANIEDESSYNFDLFVESIDEELEYLSLGDCVDYFTIVDDIQV